MERATLFSHAIRWGIRCVPNHLLAYRACASFAPFLVRPLPECRADTFHIGHCSALWLAHHHDCDARVILYLHGGGYALGSTRTHLQLAGRLARAARAQVLMVDYRLAPKHPYPAALDDAMSAYQYLLDRRVSPEQIIIAGDSAGGGLAVSTALRIRDQGLPQPAGVLAISPWLDLSCETAAGVPQPALDPLITARRIRYFAQHYIAGEDCRNPGISPYFAQLDGLPPMLIQVGEKELLLEECRSFTTRALAVGVDVELDVWPDMFHVWHLLAAILPEGRKAIRKAGRFARHVAPVVSGSSDAADLAAQASSL